ncbi:MAG: hypothetical protein JHD04_05130 [Nocardioides sp.]|nr:hypothetical protein [Nocardioides sp.]
MTAESSTRPLHDPFLVAAEARAVLSCATDAGLVVEGAPDVLRDDTLGMAERDGVPTFTCSPAGDLALAAARGAGAVLTVDSALAGPAGARPPSVTVSGRLALAGLEACPCCEDERQVVRLVPEQVALQLTGPDGAGTSLAVPVEEYAAPAHALNRGYLQRCVEHAGRCHPEELRASVALAAGVPVERLIAAELADLTAGGVDVRWIDDAGAHVTRLVFPRAARTPAELAAMLRRELGAGIC